MTKEELCALAADAMKMAYVPYSGYTVGAALLTSTGKVFTGCNIENASFTPTVCAERTAIFKAVSEGERKFEMIAVAGGKGGVVNGEFPPCGVYRQVMAEFCSPEFLVLFVVGDGKYTEHTLGEILPNAFYPNFVTN